MAIAHNHKHRRSEPGLDLHRGLVVVLMFLAHAWRLQDGRGSDGLIGWLDDTLVWMDRGVAYVAASFLFIAGFSLVLAHRDASSRPVGRWLVAIFRRAGWLLLLSILLFLPEHGVEFPDLVASSGILSVIAVAIGVTATAMVLPRSNLVLVGISLLVLGLTYGLEQLDWVVSGLNAGPGGAVPLILFTSLGVLVGRLYLLRGVNGVFASALIAAPIFVVALVQEQRWLSLFPSVYRDHGGLAIAHWLGFTTPGEGTVTRIYWNPSALGAMGLIAPVLATTAVLLLFQDRIAKLRSMQPLLLLGRHALLVFVAHYGLLGLVDLAGLRPPHAVWTLVLLVGLVLSCVGLSAAMERWSRRRRKA